MARYVDKPCRDCGEMMYGVNSLRNVCDKCQQNHIRLNNKRYYEQQKIKAAAAQITQMCQLDKDSSEAERMDLTYGYWRLWKMGVYHIG